MTLHEAIREVLIEHPNGMEIQLLADSINDQKLYKRKDRLPVPVSQIRARVIKYTDLFQIKGRQVFLLENDELALLDQRIVHYMSKVLDFYRSRQPFSNEQLYRMLMVAVWLKDQDNEASKGNEFFVQLHNLSGFRGFADIDNPNVVGDLLELIHLIVNHPNRNEVLQNTIYHLLYVDKRFQGQILPKYLCDIIGGLDIFNDPTFIITDGNTLSNYKLSIFNQHPDSSFVIDSFSDHFINHDIIELNGLFGRVAEYTNYDQLWKNDRKLREFAKKENIKLEVAALQNASTVRVICPPWGSRIHDEWSTNFVAIREELDREDDPLFQEFGRKAILVVPDSALYGTSKKDLLARIRICKSKSLESVISIPFQDENIGLKSVSILIFDFKKEHNRVFIGDFNLLQDIDMENANRLISDTINRKKHIPGITDLVDYSFLKESNYDWSPKRHLQDPFNFKVYPGNTVYKLEDLLLDYKRGKNIDRSELYYMGEIPYLMTKDLDPYDHKLGLGDYDGVDFDDFKGDEKALIVTKKSIICTLVGNHLKANLIEDGTTILLDQNLVVLNVNEDHAIAEFLALELHKDYVNDQLNFLRSGTSQPYISTRKLLDIQVQIPDLDAQKAYLEANKFPGLMGDFDNEQREDFIGTLKHSLKGDLKALSSDLKTLSSFLKNEFPNEKLLTPKLGNSSNIDYSNYTLKNTLTRMSRSLHSAHNSLQNAERVLDFEKMESTEFDLKDLINTVVDQYPNIQFKVTGKKQTIKADKVQLQWVFKNLIKNALDHGFNNENEPWKIEIHIDPKKVKDPVLITFKNNGDPFEKDFKEEDFFRKGGKSQYTPGSGFGGFLIHQIITNHKGKIELVSKDKLKLDPFKVQFKIYLPKQ